jgi:transposase
MKKIKIIVGIDVSKATLDVFIHSAKKHFVVNNDSRGFAELIEIILSTCKCKINDLFICFENTGCYSKTLSVFLQSQAIDFVMAPAMDIKKSLGITRGKNDKVDAERIAVYAYEKFERLKPTVLPNEKIARIKSLLSLRERLIKHRTANKNGICDLNDCYSEGETDFIRNIQLQLIEDYSKKINEIEKEIIRVIESEEEMKRNFMLIMTVRGVGKVLAFYCIACSENFTTFNNPRSFACYAGIAPFASSSGTVTGKSKVHPFANKLLKSILHMASISVIRLPGEFKLYYQKRIATGKSKMSSLNVIRNKIVFRIFAVVKRGSPYVDVYKYAS